MINKQPGCWAERVYAPWVDMEKLMREHQIPLYGLESLDPLREFHVIGFSLQYELSYTNVLNMLDLAGIDPLRENRTEDDPVIIAGGPCAMNPEPLADFVDLFQLGEGEEVTVEMVAPYRPRQPQRLCNKDLLRESSLVPRLLCPPPHDFRSSHV